jgi:hypothetical protein
MVTSIRSSLAATVAAGLLLLVSCDLFEATDEDDGALEPGAMQDFLARRERWTSISTAMESASGQSPAESP